MKDYKIKINDVTYSVTVTETTFGEIASTPVVPVVKQEAPKEHKPIINTDGKKVNAPMPGTILKIKAVSGSKVKKGDPIVVLEAMKMENEIVATIDGTVNVCVSEGSKVNSGDIIATIA